MKFQMKLGISGLFAFWDGGLLIKSHLILKQTKTYEIHNTFVFSWAQSF